MRVALGALFDAVLVCLEVVLQSLVERSALTGEWRDFEDRSVGVAVVIGMS